MPTLTSFPTCLLTALDSATVACDQLGVARAPNPRFGQWLPSGGLSRVLARLMVSPPSRENIRRAANALDQFSADLVAAARACDDQELDRIATASAGWGGDLWADTIDGWQAEVLVADAVAALQRLQVRHILNRE